jgi:hypothetical protein
MVAQNKEFLIVMVLPIKDLDFFSQWSLRVPARFTTFSKKRDPLPLALAISESVFWIQICVELRAIFFYKIEN